MRRCNQCILPETVTGLSFDKDGACNFCKNYKKIQYKGEERLLQIFDQAKKLKRPYDAIVPLSGGRDSSYVLYYARQHGLRILAVNFDNEFVTDLAVTNMQQVCRAVGAELQRFRSSSGLARKIVRETIRNALRYGLPTLATSFCGACSYGFRAVVYETARQYKTPLILWGDSKIEETRHMTAQGLKKERPFFRILTDRMRPRNIRTRLNEYRLRREFPSGRTLIEDLRLKPPQLTERSIQEVSIYNYIGWDRHIIKKTIFNELGWRPQQGAVTTWRTDCKLEPLVTFCFKNIFGCDKSAFGYHNMINEGLMTREEALEKEEALSGQFTPQLEDLLKKEIGLPDRDIDRIRSFAGSLAPGRAMGSR